MPTKETDWPVEKLKKWAKPALEYPKLVEIACIAQSNTEAKDKAFEFTKEQGLDEKVAMACRWLRILRAKLSEEEFKSFLANDYQKREKKEMEKKDIRTVEFQLPENTKVIQHAGDKFNNIFVSFSRKQKAIKFCNDLLEEITGIHIPSRKEDMKKLFEYIEGDAEEEAVLLELLIRVLEEKFGLKVKVCGNCKFFSGNIKEETGWCSNAPKTAIHEAPMTKVYFGCEHWAPKEVSEK